jgi:hypothetical protein
MFILKTQIKIDLALSPNSGEENTQLTATEYGKVKDF